MLTLLSSMLTLVALAVPSDFVGFYSGVISNGTSAAEVTVSVNDDLSTHISTGAGLVVNLGICGTHNIEPREFDVEFTLGSDGVARGSSTWPILGLNLPLFIEATSTSSGLDASIVIDTPAFCGDVVFAMSLDQG